MVDLRSRKALILAFVIAVVIVLLSGSGSGPAEVLLLPFLFILPLVVLYTVIKSAVGGAIRGAGTGGDHGYEGTAREILDRRYARGEIDRDEYRRAIRDLQAEYPATRSSAGALLKIRALW
jgi:putative membrane protein